MSYFLKLESSEFEENNLEKRHIKAKIKKNVLINDFFLLKVVT